MDLSSNEGQILVRDSDPAEKAPDVPVGDVLVDQTGRPLGTRARQTRQRILDATIAELASKPMRDLRVIDIARRVGSSPATFYQYFKDIEDVVLRLAEQVSKLVPSALKMIDGEWEGPKGFENAQDFIRIGFNIWDVNGPVLRVRNTASDEGDERFRDVRYRGVMPMINAFSAQIEASQARARESDTVDEGSDRQFGHVDPRVGGMLMFALINRVSMSHRQMVEAGFDHDKIVDTTAAIMQFLLSSRK